MFHPDTGGRSQVSLQKNKSRLARFQYRQPNNDLSGGQLKQVFVKFCSYPNHIDDRWKDNFIFIILDTLTTNKGW